MDWLLNPAHWGDLLPVLLLVGFVLAIPLAIGRIFWEVGSWARARLRGDDMRERRADRKAADKWQRMLDAWGP